MIDQHENIVTPTEEIIQSDTAPTASPPEETSTHDPVAQTVEAPTEPVETMQPVESQRWQVRAGREGARRVHQLIQEGKQYEKEHGLKKGRQRLRQLIELGKRYEQEHGLRPAQPKNRPERLSRMGRQELMETFLQCLLRIAKPSLRADLGRLVEALHQVDSDHAA